MDGRKKKIYISAIALLLAIVAAAALCSAAFTERLGLNTTAARTEASADPDAYRDSAEADESFFIWDGNTISGLTDEGMRQTAIIIPERCTGIAAGVFGGSCAAYVFFESDSSLSLDGAFSGAESLAYIELPEELEEIGQETFWGCSSLTSIEIPDSVEIIGDRAFQWCTGLEEATIGSGLKEIGERAFQGCSSLTSIEIPDSVESIGNYAFAECTLLEDVTIPEGTETGEYTFPG